MAKFPMAFKSTQSVATMSVLSSTKQRFMAPNLATKLLSLDKSIAQYTESSSASDPKYTNESALRFAPKSPFTSSNPIHASRHVSLLATDARGLPFLKGNTFKFTEADSPALSAIRVFKVSCAAAGDNGSTPFEVLDRSGLPAKACVRRFMDMVVVVVVSWR